MGNRIDEHRLAYFYEAVMCGSVRAAADKLDVAPSAVSRQIAQLEQEVASSLLERNKKGVIPTEAGMLLLDYYRTLHSSKEDLLAKLQELRGLRRGHVDVALGEGFVADFMGAALRAFSQEYPGVTIGMEVEGTGDALRAVVEDRAHFGLVYNPPGGMHDNVRSRLISRRPLGAAVLPGHPLTLLDRPIRLQDLLEHPVGMMKISFGTRQVLQLAEFAERVRITPHLVTNSLAVLKNFVNLGLGVAVLPDFSVTQEVQDGSMALLEIDHPVLLRAEAHVITRLGRELPSAANTLLNHVMRSTRAFAQRIP